MSQHIEIEFKNLLTAGEFLQLKTFFLIEDKDFKKQVNHYFDTPQFTLKKHGCALRIREKGETHELTLKQPAAIGLLETNQTLLLPQVESTLKTGLIPNGPVRTALNQLIIDLEHLEYFGSLTTYRAEKEYRGGLMVLDHSTYLNTEDFELEYEVTDEKKGFELFNRLLQELNIPTRKTDNKIMRFYNEKRKRLK